MGICAQSADNMPVSEDNIQFALKNSEVDVSKIVWQWQDEKNNWNSYDENKENYQLGNC